MGYAPGDSPTVDGVKARHGEWLTPEVQERIARAHGTSAAYLAHEEEMPPARKDGARRTDHFFAALGY